MMEPKINGTPLLRSVKPSTLNQGKQVYKAPMTMQNLPDMGANIPALETVEKTCRGFKIFVELRVLKQDKNIEGSTPM